MTEILLNSRVGHVKDIVASDIDDEVVMMSIENGAYYGIDPVGSRIWKLMDPPCTVSELIDRLMTEFDVDRPTCEQDVLAFLGKLQTKNVIEVRNG